MRVRLRTLSAGPKGVTPAGSVISCSDEEGEHLINSGQAERVDGEVETTAAAPPPETTAETKRTRGRRTPKG